MHLPSLSLSLSIFLSPVGGGGAEVSPPVGAILGVADEGRLGKGGQTPQEAGTSSTNTRVEKNPYREHTYFAT